MKTFLRIPFAPAPEDPAWMYKAKSGRKMNPWEVEEYLKWKHEIEHKKLMAETNYEGIPANG